MATPILIVAANLPDCDIVSLLGGSESYLHWHRNLTHSLFIAPILALALAAAFKLFRPTLSGIAVFATGLLGIASHLLEDLTNVYGVRILLPFQKTWFEWDLTPVIDYWIWAVFAIAIIGPFLSVLVGSEIGERRGMTKGRGFAIAALLFVVAYNAGRAVIHSRVVTALDSRDYSGAGPRRVAAFPASMNPFRWRGVAETDAEYRVFDLRFPDQFNPSLGITIPKAEPSPAISEAAKSSAFQTMSEFAQYPVFRVVQQPGGGKWVELSDLRFGFTSTAQLSRNGALEKSSFQFGPVMNK